MRRLRLLFVTSSYPLNVEDWRSRFISDMLTALADASDIEIRYWGPPGQLPERVTATTSASERDWLARVLEYGGLAHLLRTRPIRALHMVLAYLHRLRRAYRRDRTNIDLVHVNWLQNVLAFRAAPTPMLITVLGSDYGLLRHRAVCTLIRSALKRSRCIIAPNAGWMAARLRTEFGDLAEVQPVPFGVDAAWYSVERRAVIDHLPQRWLVVSRLTRKKLGWLLAWGASQFGNGRELHLFGPNQDGLTLPKWINYHGPTFPQELRTHWFPNAAGLITLSRHDEGRPQIVVEAMAAGLPVIASDIPGHADLIRHGLTGYLVRSAEEFSSAIELLASPQQRQEIGDNARRWATSEVGTWRDTAKRYHVLYEKLLGTPSP